MVSIPLFSFLFIYFAFLAFFLFFLIVEVGHLTATGTFTLASFWATFFVLAFTVLVLWGTWQMLQFTDWQQMVTIWDKEWIGGVLPSATF